jgi:MATE family multidrug resistance protein
MEEKKNFSYKELFLFSLPSILSSLLEPLSGTIDTAFVGQMSTIWLGGMALAVTLLSSFTWMFNFLVHASTQAVASSEDSKVCEAIKTSLSVALVVGVVTTLFLWLLKEPLFNLVGVNKELYEHSDAYYSIRIIGHSFTLLYTTILSLLRGLGRVHLGFFMIGLTTALNALLTYAALFIFDFGLEGAAWGTVLSFIVGSVISLIFLLNDKRVKGHFLSSRIKKSGWFKFGQNSLNIFGRSFTLTTCFFLSTRFAGSFGIKELAAHQILLQLWLFCSFLLDGVAVTGTVLGARYFSRGEIEKVRLIFFKLLIIGGFIGIAFTFVYALGGRFLVGLFTMDSEVIEIVFSFWILIVLSQVTNSFAFVYDGLLFGLEEFSYLRKFMIVGALFVFLPIAFFAMKNGSLAFLWVGMISLNIFRGLTGFYQIRKKVYVR